MYKIGDEYSEKFLITDSVAENYNY